MLKQPFQIWASPKALGVLTGVCAMMIVVLIIILISDVPMSKNMCLPSGLGSADSIRILLCREAVSEARARVEWEVVGLLIVSGLLGATIIRLMHCLRGTS